MRVALYMDIQEEEKAGRLDLFHSDVIQTIASLSPVEGGCVESLRFYADHANGEKNLSFRDANKIVDTYRQYGFSIRFVFWPPPWARQSYWVRFLAFQRIADEPNILNVEGKAVSKRQRKSLNRRLLANTTKEERKGMVLTTHPGHPESGIGIKRGNPPEVGIDRDPDTPRLRGGAKRIVEVMPREVQSYSTATNVARAGRRAAPIYFQKECADLSEVFGPPMIALAGYGQSNLSSELAKIGVLGVPGVEEGLEAQLRAAVALDVAEVAYWSAKHLFRNEYFLPFLRDVAPGIVNPPEVCDA